MDSAVTRKIFRRDRALYAGVLRQSPNFFKFHRRTRQTKSRRRPAVGRHRHLACILQPPSFFAEERAITVRKFSRKPGRHQRAAGSLKSVPLQHLQPWCGAEMVCLLSARAQDFPGRLHESDRLSDHQVGLLDRLDGGFQPSGPRRLVCFLE